MTDEPGLEFIAVLHVTVSEALVVGEIGAGLREYIPITGGTVEGPQLKGRVLPTGGADWALGLPDGSYHVTARYALELDDGALVTVDNRGILVPDGHGGFTGRTTPTFEVARGPHGWLRDSIFVGTLEADLHGAFVDLRFYRVT